MGMLITLPLSPCLPLNISAGQTEQCCVSHCDFSYLLLYQLPLSIRQMFYLKSDIYVNCFRPEAKQVICVLVSGRYSKTRNMLYVACLNINVFSFRIPTPFPKSNSSTFQAFWRCIFKLFQHLQRLQLTYLYTVHKVYPCCGLYFV